MNTINPFSLQVQSIASCLVADVMLLPIQAFGGLALFVLLVFVGDDVGVDHRVDVFLLIVC